MIMNTLKIDPDLLQYTCPHNWYRMLCSVPHYLAQDMMHALAR